MASVGSATLNLGDADSDATGLAMIHLENASALMPLEIPTTETTQAQFDQFVFKYAAAVTLPKLSRGPRISAVGFVPNGSCRQLLGHEVQPDQWCAYPIPERGFTGGETVHAITTNAILDQC